MCWTSPRSGCTSANNARLLETLKRKLDLGNTVIVVEHGGDLRSTHHRPHFQIRPGTGASWRQWWQRVRSMTSAGEVAGLAGPTLSLWRADHRVASGGGAIRRSPGGAVNGGRPQNLGGVNGQIRLGLLHQQIRTVPGGAQVDPAGRPALQRPSPTQAQQRSRGPNAPGPHRGPRASRQGDRHRPVADRRTPAPIRPAYEQPADHRMVRDAAGGRRAATRPAASRSASEKRAHRGLHAERRRDQDRDALSAGRLRAISRASARATALSLSPWTSPSRANPRRRTSPWRSRKQPPFFKAVPRMRRYPDPGLSRPRFHPCGKAAAPLSGLKARRVKRAAKNSKPRDWQTPSRIWARPGPGCISHDVKKLARGAATSWLVRAATVVVIEHNLKVSRDRRLDHRPRPRRRRRRRRDRGGGDAGGHRAREAQLYGAVFEAGAGAARGEAQGADGSGGVIGRSAYCAISLAICRSSQSRRLRPSSRLHMRSHRSNENPLRSGTRATLLPLQLYNLCCAIGSRPLSPICRAPDRILSIGKFRSLISAGCSASLAAVSAGAPVVEAVRCFRSPVHIEPRRKSSSDLGARRTATAAWERLSQGLGSSLTSCWRSQSRHWNSWITSQRIRVRRNEGYHQPECWSS